MQRLLHLGFLRALLVFAAVLITLAAPFANADVPVYDWRLWPSVVAPAVMMVLVFVLLLDIVMSRVFMADADPHERARLSFASRVEAVILIVLLGAWTPFFLQVFLLPG